VPISWGELVDKITILEIKLLKIFNNKSRDNIEKELKYLEEVADFKNMPEEIKDLKLELKTVNHKLWDVEDSIRDKDLLGEFDDTFLELARSVYRLNDLRARLKKSINLNLKSELVEEKSYKNFQN
jgi:hypothetical protein